MKKINRTEINQLIDKFGDVPSKDQSNDLANGIIVNLLIEIHDALIDLRGDVQASQPVSSTEPSHVDSTQDLSSSS